MIGFESSCQSLAAASDWVLLPQMTGNLTAASDRILLPQVTVEPFTFRTPHFTLPTVHIPLYTAPHTPNYIFPAPHSTSALCTPHFSLHKSNVAPQVAHYPLHTPHFILYTWRSTIVRICVCLYVFVLCTSASTCCLARMCFCFIHTHVERYVYACACVKNINKDRHKKDGKGQKV